MAQDLLWEYAQRVRRAGGDIEFAEDLETALKGKGFEPQELVTSVIAIGGGGGGWCSKCLTNHSGPECTAL